MLIVLLTFKVASRGLYLLPRTQCLSCSALDAGEPLDAVGGGGGWWEADSSLCLSHVVRHKVCLLSEYMTGEGGLLLALSHGPLDLGEQGVCLFLLGD